ncbi:MAG TPA: DUF1800 domain-containing protein [Saprospiraceae bacterium]|jgi:uncharacterized protein (DUF1800 family)|nr:DUF1800 domain-containing protein [Saprospiraceae bacterium]HMT52067.1 DUF1800 domain-containing protein [Saprospiraceae bacterium]HMT68862.1 DUF1800 domain-containing protein [Saprospiraceae bacterium]HQV65966.1 DUF1800 domain-containing protein [Saprospiraceae bacterium]HRG41933.1 DUF1800 domain-containing protein [Saprospiraceae bacterium]
MATLNKYAGPWSRYLAAHLLRRTTYGVNYDTLVKFGNYTLDQCLDHLLQPLGDPPPPINYTSTEDPNTPIGDTWVDKGTTSGTIDAYRIPSIRSWTFDLMLKGDANIREKMTMFWHNHFVTADINDPRYNYIYISLLRKNALGNFKQLTKDITIDPAMLNYLNGRDNTGQAPNENYARELMELFTLGKGPLAGPGDYTTYTEDDIKEMARVLTGWIDVRNTLPIRAEYRAGRHDIRSKTLSHRFGNVTINNAGAEEYKNLIDIIFQKDEVATFIATKLYRWFVHSNIDETIHNDVIIPMGKIIRDNNYEILPGLRALLASEHFYDECIIGTMVKNPIDFILNPINQFSASLPTDNVQRVNFNSRQIYPKTVEMQMAIFMAPSVAGWQPYYQEPSYYRLWLNATSLPYRKGFTDLLASNTYKFGDFRVLLNPINTVDKFVKPDDVDFVLTEIALILFSKPLAENQKTILIPILNLGNTGTWQTAYTLYKNNPSEANKAVVVNRLRNLLVYMMRMPEYHLS